MGVYPSWVRWHYHRYWGGAESKNQTMKHLFLSLAFFMSLGLMAQDADTAEAPVYLCTEVQCYPVYPGCESVAGDAEAHAMCFSQFIGRHIGENFTYPEEARDLEIEGRVYVSLIVEVDGSIQHVEILRGVDKILDDEAQRVVQSLPDCDKPAYLNDQAVRMKYIIPINMVLEGNDRKGFWRWLFGL